MMPESPQIPQRRRPKGHPPRPSRLGMPRRNERRFFFQPDMPELKPSDLLRTHSGIQHQHGCRQTLAAVHLPRRRHQLPALLRRQHRHPSFLHQRARRLRCRVLPRPSSAAGKSAYSVQNDARLAPSAGRREYIQDALAIFPPQAPHHLMSQVRPRLHHPRRNVPDFFQRASPPMRPGFQGLRHANGKTDRLFHRFPFLNPQLHALQPPGHPG